MRVITVAQTYRIRPSEVIGVETEYEAFCIDEVCGMIMNNIKNERYPIFEDVDVFENERKRVSDEKDSGISETKSNKKSFIEMLKEKGEIDI